MPTKTIPIRKVITITAIEQKTTSPKTPGAQGKTFWTITDEHSDFYSVFADDVRARIAQGATMALMVKEEPRGDKVYKNIVGLAEDQPGVPAASPMAPASVNEFLPGAPVSQPIQQASAPQVTQTPPPAPAKQPATASPMVAIRSKALELSVQMFVAGRITEKQIEPNANQFVGYILGEQIISSDGGSNDFIAT